VRPWFGSLCTLVAGAAFWIFIEYGHPVFEVPEEYYVRSLGEPQERFDALYAIQAQVNRQNVILDMAVFGVLLATALAVGEAMARRSVAPLLVAPPVGLVFGILAGLAGYFVYAFCTRTAPLTDTGAIQVQGAIFGLLGAGVGLALALFARPLSQAVTAVVAGMVTGVVAGVLYPVGVALLLPRFNTESLIPVGTPNRLLWIGLVSVLLGLCIPWVAFSRKTRSAAKQEA